jgi:hypothetical protein
VSDDNIMYDSPLEFMHEVAEKKGECVAQSVIPLEEGVKYVCACSCEKWEIFAPSREEGLHQARLHTHSVPA